ncbi:hypothetical protein DUI87_16660 [Hirundo rustica rustica]|uniref:Uncharacterized protein n=1 Tax=Hirundo rustica rustica TaxID=333673 RepID=A0A3M0K7B8_HIRRU|nr:hypothetical protein DUI87_16660 [Hirundo rustica rustica]
MLHSSIWERGVSKHERNTSADTKDTREAEGEGAPGTVKFKQVESNKEGMELNMPMSQSESQTIQKIKAAFQVSLLSISKLRYELAERLSLRWRQIIPGVSMCSRSQEELYKEAKKSQGSDLVDQQEAN